MIIDFKFKNYLSFADECKFTMSANSDKSHEDNLILEGKQRLSKTRIIYGANASGKSSFVSAMRFLSAFIYQSNGMLEKMPIKVMPFKFRENCYSMPTEFAIVFLRDGIKYSYQFSCTRERVIDEKLEAFYSSKPTLIFSRKNTSDYIFNKDVKILTDLKEKNLENKLFLVTCAAWNYEKIKPVVDYLMNSIETIDNIDLWWHVALEKIVEKNEFASFKAFCLKILSNADISISDFEMKTEKFKETQNAAILTKLFNISDAEKNEFTNNFFNLNVYNFTTFHDILTDISKNRYNLKLEEESLGTVYLFKYAPILYNVFTEGKVLIVDEIDKSLHPLLVKYLIKLFLDKDVNKHNAQLVANTHDTNLLDLNIFRRDDIWFTERDYRTGATEMYSLADFSPRLSENIEKSYLLGRYGAIPFIKEE